MNFDEDDLRAVKDYEEKVAFLRSERERYKGMLDKEFTKNCNNIKDAIRKFNIKVTDLNTLKMKIESAIIQEQTLQNTRRIWQLETVNLYKRQNDILYGQLHIFIIYLNLWNVLEMKYLLLKRRYQKFLFCCEQLKKL